MFPFISKYFHEQQHGGTPKKSIITNLLHINLFTYKEDILKSFEKNNYTIALNTDHKKAFDSVNHTLLIQKLQYYGVLNNLLKWFSSYLKNRIQLVKFRDSISRKINVTSGVRQGSHLAILLFNIFINDIVNHIHHSKIIMYIDNIKLYRSITCDDDIKLLNLDFQNIIRWNKKNGMELQLSKCVVLRFTKQVHFHKFSFKVDNFEIEYVDNIKDLGVIFDSKLDFKLHIHSIIAKAKRNIFFLIHYARQFTKIHTIITLYNSLVKSSLMFESIIWEPEANYLTYEIEKIQNKFLRFISFKLNIPMRPYDHNYENILNRLNIMTLNNSRIFQNLLFLYKIFNNYIESTEIINLFNFYVPARNTRNHNKVFFIPKNYKYSNYKSNIYKLCKLANNNYEWFDLFDPSISHIKLLIKGNI